MSQDRSSFRFQSTPARERATVVKASTYTTLRGFNPRPHVSGRLWTVNFPSASCKFQSTPARERATFNEVPDLHYKLFQSTPARERATKISNRYRYGIEVSIHART